MRPAAVSFYFDADVLGLAKVICGLRADATYPGDPGTTINGRVRPPCDIGPATPDVEWIESVAGSGWIIITRDSHIQKRRRELDVVREQGARMIAISGRDGSSKWSQLEIVMSQWHAIENLRERRGPFVYAATRTSMREVRL